MLVEVLAHIARRDGDQPAMVSAGGWVLTRRDLDRLSDEAAVGLARRGVRAGQVVALALPSTPDYLVAYAALAKLGAITAGVNPRLAAPERTRLVNDAAQADHVLATADLATDMSIDAPVIDIAPADAPDALLGSLRVAGEAPPPLPHDPDRVEAIVFTSGTTGLPKGAVFTDRELRANAVLDRGNGWGEGGDITGNTQFCHIGFMAKVGAQLAAGTAIHVVEPWRARDVLAAVSRHRMPAIGGVAPQLALMLREPGFDSFDLSHVRLIVCGGAPASGALIREARDRFGADWTQRYSCTESGGVGCFTWVDAPEDEMLFTVGRPRPGVDVEIRDGDGRRVRDGETGEVCLRSAAVMRGYWRNPEATARALRDGWLHTGDEGFIDERGCLHLLGRQGEAYSRGGYVVHPKEIENVLGWHPKVSQVTVVPRPDEVMGSIGVAVVVPRDTGDAPTLDELRGFAAAHLAKFKLPEALRVVDSLPATAMLKVDRRALAAREQVHAASAPVRNGYEPDQKL
jgi:acyl-CoA synthetase (AMP-forming)/AMP-acid ligase II